MGGHPFSNHTAAMGNVVILHRDLDMIRKSRKFFDLLTTRKNKQKKMANSNFSKMRAEGKALRRITPQQQLWALTNDRQQRVLRQVLRRLKKRDQEDLCYGMVAFMRFGICRPYECPFMQAIYESFIELVEGQKNNNIV